MENNNRFIPKFINASDYFGQQLINEMTDRLRHNKNIMTLFRGQTGEGKSLSALTFFKVLSYEINRQLGYNETFTIDNVFFEAKEVIKKIQQFAHDYKAGIYHRGYIFFVDDAGFALNNREWYEDYVSIFGMTSQGYRYLNLVAGFSVPFEDWIELRTRSLIHYKFSHSGNQGNFKIYRYMESEEMSNRYKEFPIYDEKQLTEIQFGLPDNDFIEQYDAKKSDFMAKYLDSRLDEIVKKSEFKGYNYHCIVCGNDYFGKTPIRSTCTKCGMKNTRKFTRASGDDS